MDLSKGFFYSSTSPRVFFGRGTVSKIPDELRRLGVSKPLLISSPFRVSLAYEIAEVLKKEGIKDMEFLTTALVHNPSYVIDDAVPRVEGRDCLVSLGGGSAVGLGKALALRTSSAVPHITIPTTYSGSEMTPIIGEMRDGKKVSTSDPRVLPAVVIYDVDLTLDLPPKVTAPSGINAIAHSIEALYAENANPVTSLLALESIRALVPGLVKLATEDGSSVEARTRCLYGAFLAGTAVATTGIALQHKLAHAAGGTLNLPHADTHSIILPHSVAYNASALSTELVGKLCEALSFESTVESEPGGDRGGGGGGGRGVGDGGDGGEGGEESRRSDVDRLIGLLNALNRKLGIPQGLKSLEMAEVDIDRVTDVAFEKPYWNPRELKREKIREVVRRAWAGEEARADL